MPPVRSTQGECSWHRIGRGASGEPKRGSAAQSRETHADDTAFVHNREPDTVMAVFNSPFGPDVLVVTDKL